MLQGLQLSAHFGRILFADMLQMSDSGIWGNPLGFKDEAMQVQEHTCNRQALEIGSYTVNLPLLGDCITLT